MRAKLQRDRRKFFALKVKDAMYCWCHDCNQWHKHKRLPKGNYYDRKWCGPDYANHQYFLKPMNSVVATMLRRDGYICSKPRKGKIWKVPWKVARE